MNKIVFYPLILILLLVNACNTKKTNSREETGSENPLFTEFNKIIQFGDLTPKDVTEAGEYIISKSKESVESLYNISELTFESTFHALDNIAGAVDKIHGSIYLIAYTHPDSVLREAAMVQVEKLEKFDNELRLDEDLYKTLKAFSVTEEAKNLTGYKKRFVEEQLKEFERNGLALPEEKRKKLKALQDKMSETGIAFNKNINEYENSLILNEEELTGLPDDYKKARKTDDGKYKIDLSYPSYYPFMKFAESDDARKQLYIKFNTRAAGTNLDVLNELLGYRQKEAKLLGYETYAERRLEDRMAKTPDVVWAFEESLTEKVKEKAKKDYDELLKLKKNRLSNPSEKTINPWESGFYSNLLLKEKYKTDEEKLKEYFVLDNVLEGLFTVTQKLFNIKYEEIINPSVWHEEVRLFEVKDGEKTIGRFYLDLHPRENKYKHAACFPMISGKSTPEGYQLPTAALVCNFPKATEDRPALMPHSQVETFFHEFGHVLHHMLTESPLALTSGTSVPRDFVEAPSQIFENWTWNYDVLKLFAVHYETGEVLPKEMFDKMYAAKNVGSGLAALQQIFYGTLDMTLHDRFDPEGSVSTTDVVRKLQNKITLYPYLEGTNFQASFGHLNGYGAGYYGYLWSKVYAEDMFSVFEQNGILDQETGLRYRAHILSKGGNEDPMELIKAFLGREPNQEAFLESLGL